MQIVISHLTRMNPGHVCVAGVDLATNTHIRPVLPRPQLFPVRHCQGSNPLLRVRAVMDLGEPKACGCFPEVEDHECWLPKIRRIRQLPYGEFWGLLTQLAQPDLGAIFGPALQKTGNTYATHANQGTASLGCLRPSCRNGLLLKMDSFEEREKVRLSCSLNGKNLSLPVTDARLYSLSDSRIDRRAVNAVNGLLQGTEDVLLCVGLTRPFMEKHWLQVNNIYFEKTDLEEYLN